MAKLCRDFLNAYENFNYDIKVNGELRILKTLEKEFSESAHIFDVGANVGDWALLAASCFPNATIHAFEIVPQTFQKFSKNIENNKAIVGSNIGLSDFEGVLDIRYFPDDTGSSGFTDHVQNKPFEMIKGSVISGDFYMEKQEISNIEFLKIDVEGGEHKVLKGFSQALNRQRIDVIQFEYGTVNITTKYLLADYYKWFGEKGYVIGKIFPDYVAFKEYEYADENFIGPNFLAVKKSRKDLIEKLS